jgi:hypothetical protein
MEESNILDLTNKYGKKIGESLDSLASWLEEHFSDGWADSVRIVIKKLETGQET